jgi:hypothetical protein
MRVGVGLAVLIGVCGVACAVGCGSGESLRPVHHQVSSLEDVMLETPTTDLHVGSWVRIGVMIGPASGIHFDELTFEVPGGPSIGHVSPSKDERFDPANPSIVLNHG